MRMKPTMGKRVLRSILVATFSAAVALVALSGQMEKKVDDRADSKWPAVAVNTTPADSATSSGG